MTCSYIVLVCGTFWILSMAYIPNLRLRGSGTTSSRAESPPLEDQHKLEGSPQSRLVLQASSYSSTAEAWQLSQSESINSIHRRGITYIEEIR